MVAVILVGVCACDDVESDGTDVSDTVQNATDDSKATDEPTEEPTEDSSESEDENGGLEEALPEEKYYNVTYSGSNNGKIEGNQFQVIKRGESGTAVTAVADEGYVFLKWNDGVLEATRTDEKIYEDLEVYPVFVSCDYEYTVTYELRKNGKLIENHVETAKASETVSFKAPPLPLAYTFGKWSDDVETPDRVDTVSADGKVLVLNYEPLCLNNVPSIEIDTEDGGGVTRKDIYKTCTVSVSNAPEGECFEGVSALIRGRGNSSWTYPKKGFKLKFDKKQSMLGSEYEAKNWVFISNYGDKSLIRNMLAYDMSEAFYGLDFTVKHEFIDVYLDGEYYGLFMMCDRIDEKEGRLGFDAPISENPAEMGYIIEIGMTDRQGTGKDSFSASRDKNRSYSVSFPDPDDPDFDPDVHLAYISDYVDQCLAALSAQDWDLICELIDVDSFIDYYIIQELYMNKDCFWRSVHFYKEPGGKLHAGPLWDMDQGLGNVSDLFGTYHKETTPTTDLGFADSTYNKSKGTLWIASANTWYRRLVRNEEFIDLLCQRLVEYGPVIMDIAKAAETDGTNPDSYYAKYGQAMERNFERWKIMGAGVWPNTATIVNIKTVSGQIDYMHDWLIERYYVICDYYNVPTDGIT
jgi:hypothetical protein